MRVNKTSIKGVLLIQMDPVKDERGFFSRTFSREDFSNNNLCADFDFDSISFNLLKATLRGLHYQMAPFEETKLVRCSKGAIFDVVVDVRNDSATYGKCISTELSETHINAIYIPPGCAHGFITLADNTQVDYKIKGQYDLGSARGCRFDDPGLAIVWPEQPKVISKRDSEFPWLFGKRN